MAANSWRDYFISCIGNEEENKNAAVYLAAWAQGTANNAKLTLLNNDASMTIFAVNANNKIVVVHSFRNIGGSILQPANSYGALIGNGCIALAIIVDKASLLSHVNVATPTYKTIIACLDKAKIKALPCPTQSAACNFHSCTSFLSAPWLLEVVLDANTSDPALFILAASKATAEFDHNFNHDPDYVTGAEDQLKEFALWEWCALGGKIP
jgi:hypothetical protein